MRSLCALAFVLLATGCAGGGQDALRKEIEALRQEVGRVRADNNILTARVETLELTNTKLATRPPAAIAHAPKSAEDDRPSLDVVHLAPTAEGGTAASLAPIVGPPIDDDPGGSNEPDDTPRPVLRSTARGEVITQPVAPAPATLAKAKRTLPSTPRTAP